MLLPAPTTHEHLPLRTPPLPIKRKRGGQRGNSNARTHGGYASGKRPARFNYLNNPVSVKNARRTYEQTGDVSTLHTACEQNQLDICIAVTQTKRKLGVNEYLFWTRQSMRMIKASLKLKQAIWEAEGRQSQLRNLASFIYPCLNYEFSERGIPQIPLHTTLDEQFFPVQKIFVSQELNNFRANLPPRAVSPILPTDDQWYFISEAIHVLAERKAEFRKYKRRKPDHDPRLLIHGVLVKLAFDLKWEHVPGVVSALSPQAPPLPLRAAQKLYRDLFNIGLLQPVYFKLAEHLNLCAETSLQDLVLQGCFQIKGGKTVILAPKQPPTWEKLTALLLLQRAHHVHKVVQRKNAAKRRRHGQI